MITAQYWDGETPLDLGERVNGQGSGRRRYGKMGVRQEGGSEGGVEGGGHKGRAAYIHRGVTLLDRRANNTVKQLHFK